ncbi:DUF4247 domain-containing protein [Paenibacillus psychroresistens]|uniref:DUF4247 domain-containing protein n=1 Tax=Paenibacillus psychroresistens TaxID=1778678 RepID=A0A6B8RMB4_9BACL|nr:DUF4247 domain-containing protein [Paenibacillus psychroresistens]QGQ97450.1 DUF4247 domain-containing protein [Paenibacillus psychroresistens]
MKRWYGWIALGLIFTLLLGCSNASNYIKETYPLVDVQGKGKENAKVYSAENQDVPLVATELAQEEAPKEQSKESKDKMFLVYKTKIINIQKDPANEKNSLIEIDSIEYAKDNYASDFLKTYLTASVIQAVLGELSDNSGSDYGGYSSQPSSTQSTKTTTTKADSNVPTTSDRAGSFNSKSKSNTSSATSELTRKNDGSKPSFKKPSTSEKSGTFTKKKK